MLLRNNIPEIGKNIEYINKHIKISDLNLIFRNPSNINFCYWQYSYFKIISIEHSDSVLLNLILVKDGYTDESKTIIQELEGKLSCDNSITLNSVIIQRVSIIHKISQNRKFDINRERANECLSSYDSVYCKNYFKIEGIRGYVVLNIDNIISYFELKTWESKYKNKEE